jgi:single-stranded-DNA-specific exonuclease
MRVLGACASTIRRQFWQPVVVMGFKGDQVVGEGRAPAGFDIFAAFQYCQDLFVQFGGHRGAGGFSMDPKNINAFRQRINQYAQEVSGWRFSPAHLRVDALLDPARLDRDDLIHLQRLAPFGQANPDPQFCCQKARVETFSQPGNDGTLGTLNDIPFRLADARGPHSTLLQTLTSTRLADVVYNVTLASDRGIILLVEDIKVT